MALLFHLVLLSVASSIWSINNCLFPTFLRTKSTNRWWSDLGNFNENRQTNKNWWPQIEISPNMHSLTVRYGCQERLLTIDSNDDIIRNGCKGLQRIVMTCLRSYGVRDPRYVVEMYRNNRRLYQCVKFVALDSYPHEIFELYQSRNFLYRQDASLCTEENLVRSPIIWIPDLTRYKKQKWLPCPLNGGFQIKNMINHSYKKQCKSKVYVSLECDCISGEGCEINFNSRNCNPFENSQSTQFQCFSNWKTHQYYYATLVARKPQNQFIIITLKYPEQIRYSHDYDKYEDYQDLTIYRGLQIDTIPYSYNKERNSGQFKVQIRRAFGSCDDEKESCELGCKADASNQLFCHKTCPTNQDQCKHLNRDSCTFDDRYQGKWDLWVRSDSSVKASEGSFMQGSITIGKNTLAFNSTLSDRKDVKLQCIRENNEFIQDNIILGLDRQPNGCRVRDICIQLYQSSTNRFYQGTSNTNTLFYKISRSARIGTDIHKLCQFKNDEAPLNDKYRSAREKSLVKSINKIEGQKHNKVKCALYKILLEGNFSFHMNNNWFCPVQMYDYNDDLGSTGEFDNILRIRPGCNTGKNLSWLQKEHECISVMNFKDIKSVSLVRQLITYHNPTNSYYCWLIYDKSDKKIVLYDMYLFQSPQCQYEIKDRQEITIIKEKALARFLLRRTKLKLPSNQPLVQSSHKTNTVHENINNWKPVGEKLKKELQQKYGATEAPKMSGSFITPSSLWIVLLCLISISGIV